MTYAVELEAVSFSYGARRVVRDVNLVADAGEILGLVGENGAGKTTLLRLLTGLLRPDSGSIRVAGEAVVAGTVPAGVGALIEEPAFYPWATGRQNLLVMCAGRREREQRVDTLLDDVGLGDHADRAVRTYSQGMRQRLGIARCLLGRPSVLVLDEPANGLDPSGLRWLRTLLHSCRAEGTTVIVSSHILSQLERDADRVAVVTDGRVVKAGPLDDLAAPGESLEDLYFRIADEDSRTDGAC